MELLDGPLEQLHRHLVVASGREDLREVEIVMAVQSLHTFDVRDATRGITLERGHQAPELPRVHHVGRGVDEDSSMGGRLLASTCDRVGVTHG